MTLKLGKRPANPETAPKLKFRNYIDQAKLPPLPTGAFGHQALVKSFGMLANDRLGCCVISGAGHEVMLWNAEAATPVSITDASTIKNYELFTGYNPSDPDSDQGTDMSAAAARRRKTGLVDATGKYHKIGAYVALTPGDWTELRYATYLLDGVGIGINFDERWMTAFNQHKPWDVLKHPKWAGGHYVTAVGFDGLDIEVVTWGALQKITQGGYKMANDETFAYISAEKLKNGKSLEGFDLAALTADLTAITTQ